MLGDKTRADRVYDAATRGHRAAAEARFGRTDYGSSLRDASAFVALASEGKRAPGANPQRRSNASRRRVC